MVIENEGEARPRKQRATSPRTKKLRHITGASRSLKEKWADPEWRTALLEKRQRVYDDRKAKGIRRPNRMGVPDGMRRAEVEPLWAQARQQAKRFIEIMEDAGELPKVVIPGTEEEMAKKTLEEAFVMAVSPLTDAKSKAAYLRLVLEFTKSKPESKSKLTLDKSEEWLAELSADMKNDGSTS